MALLVWLPLDGDFRNLGVNPVLFTNSGVTFTTNGKLFDSCSSFNGSARLYTDNILNGNNLSASCWVKIANTSTLYYYISVSTSSGFANQNIGLASQNGFWYFLGNGIDSVTYAAEANVWHHLCVTVEDNKIIGYLDGNQVASGTKAPLAKLSFINIGCRSNNGTNTAGNYFLNGNLQDVRIYDHVLSPYEVKLLSQGLIAHYLFNYSYPNLLKLGAAERSCPSLSAVILHYYFDFTGMLPTGTYTLSFDAKNSNGTDRAYFSIANGDSTLFRIGELNPGSSSWKHYTYTFNNSSNNVNNLFFTCYKDYGKPLNNNNTGTLYIKNVKLENGNIETPFVQASSEGYSWTNLYDTSGYNHNAILNGTGNLSISTNTPRYLTSLGFPSTLYYKGPSPSNKVCTISLWVKWNSIPSGQSIIYVDGYSKSGFGLVSNGILTSTTTTSSVFTVKSDLVANLWYHFIIVCPDGSVSSARKLYINGVEQTSVAGSSNWSYGNNEIKIGKRPESNDGFSGYLTDFRMYSTILSESDILELYNTSMSIDASGNISPRILTS